MERRPNTASQQTKQALAVMNEEFITYGTAKIMDR